MKHTLPPLVAHPVVLLLLLAGCGSDQGAPARPPGDPAGRAAATSPSDSTPVSEAVQAEGSSAADVVPAPLMDGDVMLIDVVEVREKLESGAPLLVVDTRGGSDFDREHIPGSINIPLPKIAAAGELPGIERDYEIVVYCIAESCPTSRNAARVLARLGYTNVKDMRVGLVGWKRAGFATATGGG